MKADADLTFFAERPGLSLTGRASPVRVEAHGAGDGGLVVAGAVERGGEVELAGLDAVRRITMTWSGAEEKTSRV